jgi:hypothetical protein
VTDLHSFHMNAKAQLGLYYQHLPPVSKALHEPDVCGDWQPMIDILILVLTDNFLEIYEY